MKLSEASNKKLEVVSNVVILIVAIVLGTVLAKNHLFNAREPTISRPVIGQRLAVPGITFSTYRKTLLLALRDGCHYCEDSVPFYRKLLSAQPAANSVHVVAVLPLENDRNYPARLGLNISDVRLLDFKSLKINATPTLVVLDNSGRVTDVWVGELSAIGQSDVLRALALDQSDCAGAACNAPGSGQATSQ